MLHLLIAVPKTNTIQLHLTLDTITGQQKLYVGNLPYDVNREEIEEYFGRFGTILDLYIPLKDGRCRGFAFVTLDEAAANEAIKEADGAEFLGRPLVVNVPQPKGEERWSGERLPRRPSPRSQDNSRNKCTSQQFKNKR